MEIRFWSLYCVVFNFALFVPCTSIKTFSLNEAIAAESSKRSGDTTKRPKLKETTAERFSLNKYLSSPVTSDILKLSGKNLLYTLPDNIISRSKLALPHKSFQIKSPLKPKKFKVHQSLFKRREKDNSVKRHTNNEKLTRKYIPLLKDIGMLFDNLLADANDSSDKSERDNDNEITKNKRKYNNRFQSKNTISEEAEEAIAASTIDDPEISIAPTEPFAQAANFAASNFGSLRKNKIIPLLLARNTPSPRRKYSGLRARSSSAFHSSLQRNLSRNNGVNKHNTAIKRNEASARHYGKNTDSNSRHRANSSRFNGGLFDNKNATDANCRETYDAINQASESKAIGFVGRNFTEPPRQNQFEIGGNTTENSLLLREFSRRLRESVSADKVSNNSTILQINQEDNINVTKHYNSSNKTITIGNGTTANEIQEFNERDEVIIPIKNIGINIEDLSKAKIGNENDINNRTGVVIIIDGYSLTRDKNGDKKIARRSIHILN